MLNDALQDMDKNDHFNSLVPETPINRRGFIAAAIAAGFAVAADPVLGQAVTTPMDGLEGGDTRIGDIPAYFAVKKGGGKRPVVIVIPEIFGLHEYQKDMCRRLAQAGYFGVSLDPFFRLGDLSKIADIEQVIALANQLTDAQAFADLDAVVAWTEKHKRANAGKLGLTGMCRGGRMVWMYSAQQKKIDTAVAWYGSLMPILPAMPLGPLDITDKVHAPVLGLYGSADQGIPMEHVERMPSTPITGRPTARRPPTTGGKGCWPGSRSTAWHEKRGAKAPLFHSRPSGQSA